MAWSSGREEIKSMPSWEFRVISVVAGDEGGTTIKDRKWRPGQADRRVGVAGWRSWEGRGPS